MTCKPKVCAGDLKASISIERRSLVVAAPGSAAPSNTYTNVFSARAKIETKQGVSEYAKVEIGGERVTHAIWIRHTTIAFDVRDRVKDGSGNLYKILSVENMNERGNWFRLHCKREGNESKEAVA